MHQQILDLVGNTPMVHIPSGLAVVSLKLESFNPGGSVKDRAVMRIIADAEHNGQLRPGSGVVEATSGNTGVAVAMVCAARGYRAVIVTHDKASREKIDAMAHFGARVVVANSSAAAGSSQHYIEIARRLAQTDNLFLVNQFENQLNPLAHFESTGPEIWQQTDERVTCVVCGIGSGGTITGVGRYLKARNPKVRIVAADPVGSVYASVFHGRPRPAGARWATEGVGSDFMPGVLDWSVVDDVVSFTDAQARSAALQVRTDYAISIGLSAGGALHVAQGLDDTVRGDCVVVVAPDAAERYFSKLGSPLANERREREVTA